LIFCEYIFHTQIPVIKSAPYNFQNPYTGAVLAHGASIAGLLDILPVGPSIFLKIVKGGFNDRDLSVEDVLTKDQMLLKEHQPISLFVSCAVIHPKYRGKGVMNQLFREYRKQLDRMINWGVEFDRVVGDCVTIEGERFSQKIGMEFQVESDHGTKIYAGSFLVFDAKISLLSKI